jgi:CBS-domain-containing membrane protein
MRAADVMSTRVVTAGPLIAVRHAAQIMINHRISGVPIVEGDWQLIGIITEGDLLRRAETGTERQRSRWGKWLFGARRRLHKVPRAASG